MNERDQEQSVFNAYLAEYGKLRDEVVQRISLQGSIVHHAMYLTGVGGAVLAAGLGTVLGSTTLAPVDKTLILWWVAVAWGIVYGLLLLLLLGNWLHHQRMTIKLSAYLARLRAKPLPDLLGDEAGFTFRWETLRHGRPAIGVLCTLLVLVIAGLLAETIHAWLVGEVARTWVCFGGCLGLSAWFGLLLILQMRAMKRERATIRRLGAELTISPRA